MRETKRERERESSEARQIQWNPPSSQMNITASLPPSFPACLSASSSFCLHRRFFPLLSSLPTPPSPLRLHYSSPLLRDPGALGPSCRRHRCSNVHILQFGPGCRAIVPVCHPPFLQHSSFLPLCTAAQPWILREGPSLPPGGRMSRRPAVVSAAHKRNARGKKEKKRGFFLCASRRWKNPARLLPLFVLFSFFFNQPSSSSPLLGLQFWLCVGTRKRGPKCLKPITCSRCRGVTSRCVTLL